MSSLHSWFRVELDSSGAILSCKAVDKAEASGRCVRYVEALSSAEACTVAKEWWERRRAQTKVRDTARIGARRARGLCTRCGKNPLVNAGECAVCVQRRKKMHAERAAGRALLRTQHPDPAEARSANLAACVRSHKTLGGDRGKAYRMCLRRFDTLSPEAFRAWIVAEINRRSAPEKAVK